MKSKVFLVIGLILLIAFIFFVIFALNHPEMSLPVSANISLILYLVWVLTSIAMLVLSFVYRNK